MAHHNDHWVGSVGAADQKKAAVISTLLIVSGYNGFALNLHVYNWISLTTAAVNEQVIVKHE